MQVSEFDVVSVGAVVKAKTQDKEGTPGPIRSAMPFTDVRERDNTAVYITDPEGVPVNVTVGTIDCGVPDARVRFICPRDRMQDEFKGAVHDESTAQVNDEFTDLVHDEFMPPPNSLPVSHRIHPRCGRAD